MNKYICILSVLASCITSLHAMEIEQKSLHIQSPLLTENTLDTIHKQQQGLYKTSSIHSLALSEMHQYFCNISDNHHKRSIIKTMSTQLLLLSCIATYLPPELVHNNICFFMLDCEENAAKQFYTTPIGQAFDLYQAIKIWLADDTKPIGPLYALPQAERNALLGVKLSWYYPAPIINGESEELLNGLPDELKHMYLHGKNPRVLKNQKNLCKALGAGSCVFGSTCGSIMAVGSSCGFLNFPPFWLYTIFPIGLGMVTCIYIDKSNPCCQKANF